MHKFIAIIVTLLLAMSAHAEDYTTADGAPSSMSFSPKSTARAAAVADSVSTYLAIAAGGAEMNPLVSTSPMGLVVLAGMKLGFVELADHMEPAKRATTLRTVSAVWGGVSVSNILLALSVSPPVAAVVAVASGLTIWSRSEAAPQSTEPVVAMAD